MKTSVIQKRHSTFKALFKRSDYLKFWMGQAISQFGDTFTSIAVPLSLYQLTKSPVQLGLGFFVSSIPWILIGPIAGGIVDHIDRKKILWLADSFRMLLTLSLLWAESPLHFYIVSFLVQAVACIFAPTRAAIFPILTSNELHTKGLSLSLTTWQIVQVIGPGIASLLLSITNKNVLFFIDSLTFGIAAILTFWIKTNLSAQGENKKISVLDSLNSGFKLIIRKQHLAYLLWLDIIISIVSSSINISSLLFIQLKFGQQEGEVFYSLSVMLISIGLAVGSLVIGFFDKVSYRRYFALGGLLLQGISYLILYFVSNSALIAVLFFASGLGASGGLIPLSACYSDWTQEEIRGRVYSLVNSLKRLSAVVAYLVVGYLIELISAIHVILITGILMNIGVLVITIYFNGWKLFNMKNEDN